MKPLIGVSASLEGTSAQTQMANIRAIERSGGIPLIIPFLEEEQNVASLVHLLDGLLLTGGGDVDPVLFGEEPIPALGLITPERDWLEGILITEFLTMKKPILGICRGCQILNVIAGGGMYQDIYSQREGELLQHKQQAPRDHVSHSVRVERRTKLSQIIGKERFRVNSFHHQSVDYLAPGFVLSATSSDGVIEAFESKEHPFVIGVQWHPEDLFETQEEARLLFDAFVKQCKKGPS